MSDVFLEELDVPEPDHVLGVGSGSHAEQIARVLERLEPVLQRRRRTWYRAGRRQLHARRALARAKLRLAVAHVESGLRSFDRTMPEEINRIVDRPPVGALSSCTRRRRSRTSAPRVWGTSGCSSSATR